MKKFLLTVFLSILFLLSVFELTTPLTVSANVSNLDQTAHVRKVLNTENNTVENKIINDNDIIKFPKVGLGETVRTPIGDAKYV